MNWKDILTGKLHKGIQFKPESDYIAAFVIPAIYEFQDPKDMLFYTEKHISDIVKHSFQTEALWKNPEIDYKSNITTFKSSMLGGTVIFQVISFFQFLCSLNSPSHHAFLADQYFISDSQLMNLDF